MSLAINLMERESEGRKVLWALLAAILIHLVIAFSLAAFGHKFSASFPVAEDRPAELTIVNVAPTPVPLAPPNAQFMETDESKKSAKVPEEKTFESNANSIAASQLPATGDTV